MILKSLNPNKLKFQNSEHYMNHYGKMKLLGVGELLVI